MPVPTLDAKAAAALVKSARKTMGLTQDQFADNLGVSRRSVIRWEQGQGVTTGVQLMIERALAPPKRKRRAR